MKGISAMVTRAVLVCTIAPTLGLPVPSLLGATLRVCSHSGLADALGKGGTIRFGCNGPIRITNSLVVNRDAVLDASDHTIRLFKGESGRILQINPGVTLTLINLSLENGVDPRGGSVLNLGRLILVDCSLLYNDANGGPDEAAAGGAIWNGDGAVVAATNCTFAFNSVGGSNAVGGAIYNEGSVTLLNCTFFRNTASRRDDAPNGSGAGGGIFNARGTVEASHCTFLENGALSFCGEDCVGGAVANLAGTLTIRNCILANSLEVGNASGTIFDAGHNISSDDTCHLSATGSFNQTDPKLATLLDVGGPTRTVPLLPDSPAIDAADPAFCPATDQRGMARPDGGACDIGAFEGVLPHPMVRQMFSPAIVSEGNPATLIFTVSNPAPIFLTLRFTNQLPEQIKVFEVPIPYSSCGRGGLRWGFGTSSFEVTDLMLAPSNTCNISLVVTSSVHGVWTNLPVQIFSSEAGAGPFSNPAALAVSGKPVAVTGPASDRTLSSVRLHGTINPSGFATAYHFEYAIGTNNLDSATETQILNDGFSESAIIAGVTGLSAATTYYYRLVASNLLGQACGVIDEFTLFGAARIIRLADGKAAIDFLTLPSRTNLVQVSSNLVDWATVTFLLPTNGVSHWEEPETAFPTRFFRLSLP